jgi:hypothetical protein
MDDSQRALRRAAAEAFSQSLDQLGGCFVAESEAIAAQPFEAESVSPHLPRSSAPEATPLQALEDAAADIEQLFKQTGRKLAGS